MPVSVFSSIDMSSYFENSEWAIKEMPVKRHVLPEPYPDVNFYLHLKVKARYFDILAHLSRTLTR